MLTSPKLKFKPQRIVSLVPSQTELLCFLGLQDTIVGITRFCIHPEYLKKTATIVGGTKDVKPEIFKQLNPDLIICNKEENDKLQIGLLANDFDIWVTDVSSLEDTLQMIEDIGILTQTSLKAFELLQSIKNKFEFLNFCTPAITAAYLIWQKPFMVAGGDTFINDMMGKVGLTNIFSHLKRYPEITIEDIKQSNCNVLLLSSEPYPFAQKHVDEIQKHLSSIKIILVDGEMFSWYGPRLLGSAEYFIKLRVDILKRM